MKKIILIMLGGIFTQYLYPQEPVISNQQMNEIVKYLETNGHDKEEIKKAINGIINNPDLYNSFWKNFLDQALKSDSTKWKFLEDLNIQFKTFQSPDSSAVGLGFSYDFNFDFAKFIEKGNHRQSYAFGLTTKGNVAFNKDLNPTDFLESNVDFNYSGFHGGVVKPNDSTVFTELNKLEGELVLLTDMQSEKATSLWEKFGKNLQLSNQYYYNIAPKFALESNQNFSKMQFTPGVAINLGVKSWDTDNCLSKLNFFDYPFALIRYIVRTDKKFTVYGSTIPTAQFVIDYVIPTDDTTRENLTANTDPYPRIKFEAGFRTFISRIKKEHIFFSANFRVYKEISAPEAIKEADLDKHLYYVMALQTSTGFYVSYATGKLPFDSQSDQIYSIGFNYSF